MTPDSWQDAAAFLRFATEPDPQAIEDVLARYEDADDLRRLLNATAVVMSAVVTSGDDEIKTLLRERLDDVARMFMAASDGQDKEA